MVDHVSVELLHHRVGSLENQQDEIKEVLRELTTAIHKLIIVDERQIQAALAMDRLSASNDKLHERFDELADRVAAIERTQPMQKQTSQWVLEAIKGAALLAVIFVASQAGLMK